MLIIYVINFRRNNLYEKIYIFKNLNFQIPIKKIKEYKKIIENSKKDKNQKIKSFGPGDEYMRWLKRNSEYKYQKPAI